MRKWIVQLVLLALLPTWAMAEERFPPPDFRSGYALPQQPLNATRGSGWAYADVAALTLALGLSAYWVHKKRSRRGVFLLMAASLIYFGFYRKGCVCSVGSIQNVAMALGDGGYALPWTAGAFFALPLVFTLFFGRVFCASVCPLGAIQDAVLWRPIEVPRWLETSLGLFAYFYLGLAALYAFSGSDFFICQYDPFVSFFRLSGKASMLLLGAVFLGAGLFVGRVYCRFVCPYGVLLRLLSPFSKWRVSISPDKCVDCRLCQQSCPFNAIRYPTPAKRPTLQMRDRLRLAVLLAMVPVLSAGFGLLGYHASGVMARLDSTRHLQSHPNRFAWGCAMLGVWMGLVISLKLVGHAVRRTRSEYTADAGTCLACARCYQYCPVERERLEKEQVFVG